jgi:hypothetical protein
MNPNEKFKGIWNPLWPTPRVAILRLLLIIVVLLPLEWAVYALLVGDWKLNLAEGGEEPIRHLVEGTVIFVGVVSIIFLMSLLPIFGAAHRLFLWLFSPRIAKRLLMTLIWIATLAALFYAEEDWRGAHAWNKYKQELEATGAQLDLTAYIPKQIPDDQNFAAIPLVKEWFTQRTNTARWEDNFSRARQQLTDDASENQERRTFTDLVAWQQAFDATKSGKVNPNEKFASGKLDAASRAAAAPDVLRGLSDAEKDLEQLRAASHRPAARYPVFYDMDNPWGILLPHLGRINQTCRRLQLRTCAELAAGRSEDALNDVKLMLYLADSVKDETFLISYLVRISCLQLATQPVWEGLAEHRWTDAQLQELQKQFQQYDFIADMKRPFDSERAAVSLTAELIEKKGLGYLIEIVGPGQPTSMGKKFASWCGGFVPHGWYCLEQLNYMKLCQMQLSGTSDPMNKRVFPGQIAENNLKLQQEFPIHRIAGEFLRHRLLAKLMMPALTKIPAKGAQAQVAADEVALACALERFRLANGNLPESLDALVPKFISQSPNDVIGGKPYNYRRAADGQFILYSVGWNEKDDGGKSGKTLFDEKEGDWIWQSK